MNKTQLITILQSCLLFFDGLTEKQIMELNPNYEINQIQNGIQLNEFLQEKIK